MPTFSRGSMRMQVGDICKYRNNVGLHIAKIIKIGPTFIGVDNYVLIEYISKGTTFRSWVWGSLLESATFKEKCAFILNYENRIR